MNDMYSRQREFHTQAERLRNEKATRTERAAALKEIVINHLGNQPVRYMDAHYTANASVGEVIGQLYYKGHLTHFHRGYKWQFSTDKQGANIVNWNSFLMPVTIDSEIKYFTKTEVWNFLGLDHPAVRTISDHMKL